MRVQVSPSVLCPTTGYDDLKSASVEPFTDFGDSTAFTLSLRRWSFLPFKAESRMPFLEARNGRFCVVFRFGCQKVQPNVADDGRRPSPGRCRKAR